MRSLTHIYLPFFRSTGYHEDAREVFSPILHNIMASFDYAAGTNERETPASCGDLGSKFKVFVQIQNRGDPPKPGVHQRPLLDYPDKLFILCKYFHENLLNRFVPGSSSIGVGTIHGRDILIDDRFSLVPTVLV